MFTAPVIGTTTVEEWTHERITGTGNAQNYTFLTYATCLSKGCFIVFKAFLTQPEPEAFTADLQPEDRPPPVRLTVSASFV